jgi:RimJ/RimL family protein N-acetyltransferase
MNITIQQLDERNIGDVNRCDGTFVAACRLYESCGFQLAGFDRCLYQGRHPGTAEIALYWYLVFAAAA